MQTARESSRQRRCNKRRNSRKKSLSPSDLKCVRDAKSDSKRSLSEGAKVKHRKSNIRRTLTHPFTCADGIQDVTMIGVFNREVKAPVPESDDSNIPPTSSDRDTEDDARVLKSVINRSRWDSGSEMDSLVSTVVRRASARRRRTPVNPEWGVSSEPGEASEPEAGRMRPEDYRLVFLSSDSSCREDTEDSSSTASSAAPLAPDDCDWDYFEPGAAAAPPQPIPTPRHIPQACPRTCSCGAEPRIVAVPVPVPVPVPAALWPALLAFPQNPPTPHWSTYPGFPPLDAAAFARLTTAAAVAVTAAATATANANALTLTKTLDMTTVEKTDKAIQSETSQAPESRDIDTTDNVIERPIEHKTSDEIKVIAKDYSVLSEPPDAMPEHLDAEKAFVSSNESGDSSDSEAGVERRSYDLMSGAPEEPATTDEDSDDSGGGGGQFSRVFVVNPADSSSDMEDNADSSGIDCDDSFDKNSDSLEIIAVEVIMQDEVNVNRVEESNNQNNENNVVLLESVRFNEDVPVIPYGSEDENSESRKSNFMKFCNENMLRSETCQEFNSFNASCSTDYNTLDSNENKDNDSNRSITPSENNDCDSLDDTFNAESDMKVKVSVELPNEKHNNEELISNETSHGALTKLAPSPEPTNDSQSSPPVEKIDLFKGIERTLSELLKKELLLEEQVEKLHGAGPVCLEAGGAGAPVADAVSTVCRSRTAGTDGSARFTSRVMITHDRVSVVTSDTTRLMRDITVHHTNSVNETNPNASSQQNENDERMSDDEVPQPSGGVTVVSNADTLSAVVCLEEGLADDDSWVEDVSHDEDEATSPSDSDSGDEASLPTRGEEFAYCRRSLDFTLHTIVEESCEESETEQTTKKPRPISATELEKYFFFGLGDGRNIRDDEEPTSETSSVCSEGGESIPDNEQPERSGDNDELVSSRLEKYFLSGFMGFNQERRDSDGSGSVGSDSEGRQSPEQRRKRPLRARGTPRSHSSSLDNLLTGEEPSQDAQEVSDGSSTETDDRHDSSERLDSQGESKRKKQSKKTRGSPADERRLSTEFTEETRDDTRSVSEGEDGRLTPRPEFPPLGSELSESKKQTSRDSGFVGSCDDLLRNGDSSSDFTRSHEPKVELEEIIEEIRPDIEERVEGPPTSRPPPTPLIRKDSFNNWSSDEETNLMMTKMRQFFKQMINSANVRASTPQSSNSESSRPPKPPQLLYFESELTRLMKTVPGIRDEEVREIVEYLSSEDTWSDSYDSSDYAGSDLEGTSANRSALRKQISESCREIIDEFDRGNGEAGSLERDAAGAYQRLAATLGRAGEGSPPLFGKVMRHIGGRLVALMHEVSGGVPSTDDDSASEPGALARSRSHDILEATASRGSVASDSERFSWRGSFESALLAADSRGTLGGGGCEARRSPAGAELAAQKSHSRSCGAIGGSEDRLWRGRRRASAPDAESEEEQRAGSLPRLPSIAGTATVPAGPVKSARYRAPGFRTATRAASAPGLHAPRRRRPAPATLQPSPAAPASAPSLQVEDEAASPVTKTNEKSGLITPPQNGGEESPPPEKERADQEDSEKRHAPVPHSAEGPNDDLYAIPVKLRAKKEPPLPPGWEKHEDMDGPYYWHIKSGTIQREIPKMLPVEAKESRISMVRDCSNLSEVNKYEGVMTSSVTRSTTSGALDHVDQEAERKRKEEMSYKRRSFPARPEPDSARAVRFFVRSLGWVEISEADLTPERSSRAVNKCIVDLSLGRNDLLDQVGRWGDGKDLFMDLDDGALKLIDPESLNTLHTQPIHTIRVWGVGRDNGRDFAYVARDRATRRHMCHVFRCEAPARSIANALRDICKRIMIERSLQPPPRPTDLPAARRPRPLSGASFPTPMEEPRKTVRARYLGSAEVGRATGMDVLNDALERLAAARAPSAWRPVAVAVAPSMITITEEGESSPIVECRVRYLSFLGIGRDVRRCAFIVHTAQDLYVAHAFHAEPSSGALCKTIEAACKLRYQKCLDAHGGAPPRSPGAGSAGDSRASLGQTLKSLVGSLTGRRPS